MRPRDLPPDRSLDPSPDGGRDAPRGPDGRARPPDELLDNLRLRLRDLPASHPSALRDPDSVASRDVDRGDNASAQQPRREVDGARGEHPESAKADAAERGDENAAGKGAGADAQARDRGSLADLIRAVSDAGEGLPWPGDGFLAGEMDLFGGGSGDPYRPWFMSGELGTPWFLDGDDL